MNCVEVVCDAAPLKNNGAVCTHLRRLKRGRGFVHVIDSDREGFLVPQAPLVGRTYAHSVAVLRLVVERGRRAECGAADREGRVICAARPGDQRVGERVARIRIHRRECADRRPGRLVLLHGRVR